MLSKYAKEGLYYSIICRLMSTNLSFISWLLVLVDARESMSSMPCVCCLVGETSITLGITKPDHTILTDREIIVFSTEILAWN